MDNELCPLKGNYKVVDSYSWVGVFKSDRCLAKVVADWVDILCTDGRDIICYRRIRDEDEQYITKSPEQAVKLKEYIDRVKNYDGADILELFDALDWCVARIKSTDCLLRLSLEDADVRCPGEQDYILLSQNERYGLYKGGSCFKLVESDGYTSVVCLHGSTICFKRRNEREVLHFDETELSDERATKLARLIDNLRGEGIAKFVEFMESCTFDNDIGKCVLALLGEISPKELWE
ncbi:MAG: hypothetical protein QXU93_11785 [Thermoproteus sp.]